MSRALRFASGNALTKFLKTSKAKIAGVLTTETSRGKFGGEITDVMRAAMTAPAINVVEKGNRSELEELLMEQIIAANIRMPKREVPFAVGRLWRVDFMWAATDTRRALAVEVEGMVHRIKGRFKADIRKYVALTLADIRLLRVDGDSIRDGSAIEWIKELI